MSANRAGARPFSQSPMATLAIQVVVALVQCIGWLQMGDPTESRSRLHALLLTTLERPKKAGSPRPPAVLTLRLLRLLETKKRRKKLMQYANALPCFLWPRLGVEDVGIVRSAQK